MIYSIAKLGIENAREWMILRYEGVKDFPIGFLVSEEEAANLTLKRAQEILAYGTMHGVFYDGKMIGFCGLYQENHKRTRHRAKIGPFFVTPKYHGSGAAKVLMNAVIKEALSQNVEQLELYVDTENFKAIRFYEKNGFVKKATHPDCIRIGALSRDDHFYCRRIV